MLANQEPPYKEDLDWLQFAFIGNTKSQYVAPYNTTFSFMLPVEEEPLFIPALERLQTLYPRFYACGTTYTSKGAELMKIDENLYFKEARIPIREPLF